MDFYNFKNYNPDETYPYEEFLGKPEVKAALGVPDFV
jgi:hypothetical protein